MEVQQIFKLKKDDEIKQFNDCGNRCVEHTVNSLFSPPLK